MMKSVLSSVRKKVSLHAFALMCSASIGMNATAQQSDTIAIMDGLVHTVTGSVIEQGDVIIRNGKIITIGANLAAPEGAEIIDATGYYVTPGFISPYSSIGLVEIGAVSQTNDSSPERDFDLGPALNAADAYNPASTLIPINRAGGITRAVSVPSVGGGLIGGEAIMIDLSGHKQSITKQGLARSVQLGLGGTSRAGNTRLGVWSLMRETLEAAQKYANDPDGYVANVSEGRYTVADLKALGPVLRGEQTLLVSINRASDIRNLVRLANNYRLSVVIVGGAEAWREAGMIAAAGIPVILDAMANLPEQFETLSASMRNAALLHQAGVSIGFYNPQGFGAHNLRLLPHQAGNAVANGLPYDAALKSLTLSPAAMFGLEGELGTLEVGKRGDVVVWDGDPLELATRPVAVVIDGANQSLENRQQKLRDRYRNLERGELPFAYRGGQ